MRALTDWRKYLHGSPSPFEIHSDHKNLQYFMTSQKLNRHQARWSLELAEFDFTLLHKPGNSMICADVLSRRPDYKFSISSSQRKKPFKKTEVLLDVCVDIIPCHKKLTNTI